MEDHYRSKQGLCFLLILCVTDILCVSIHYSVPEEKKSGSLVTNVLKDLKLGIGDLTARRAQLVSKSSKEYFHLDANSGNLLINEKIDREALCGQTELCLLQSEIVLQNPLELFTIEMKVEDVNDNAPRFSQNVFQLEIPENVPPNTKFPLESAQDVDLGENSIQNYTLSPNEHFKLGIESKKDGRKSVDLILDKPLDREKQPSIELTFIAVDGGVPQRTGIVQIQINVLDNNDNFPQFIQSEYRVRLKENSPRETLLSKVEARDLDSGSNAQVTYSFHRVPEKIRNLFHVHEMTGEITVLGEIDYEKETSYEMNIKATDGGGLSGYCNVLVEVEDVNDNAPEVSVISLTNIIKEDSPLNTVIALFSITDKDSGDNGKTMCSVPMNLPFALTTSKNNYYQLMIQNPLDREMVPEYNVTITAVDRGSPRLTSTRIIYVQVSDVNDNTPVFEKSLFEMRLQENNIPGLLMGSVHAIDLDMEQNGKVTYSLLPGNIGGSPSASYISVNSETGNVYALRSLDYEQTKDFRATVRASDGGIPPLSSDVVVQVMVTDENDNAPFFLYPLQNSTFPCNELLPKMAEAGYLITKVVAVDRDSGQNSWLSYELLKATDPGLFSIGAQNGEVKTRRPLTERDTNKQRLVIAVRDNGVPPQTSTAMLNILLVDGFSDPYLKVVDVRQQEPEDEGTLTMYLVICLASVSFVFLLCIVSFVGIKLCKKDHGSSFIVAPPHFPPVMPDIPENCTDSQSGSLSRNYQYDVCLTGGSLSSEFRFLRPLIPVFSVADPNILVNDKMSSGSQDLPNCLENKSKEQVQASLSEDAAPRSGGPSCAVNQAIGANVNSGQNDWLSYQ
nr:protocadherin beta-16-like isoform X2 [Anolis sagrei ordinatus]